jgi:hypothetical protein
MTTDNGSKTTRLVEAQDNKGTKYKIVSVNKVITEFYINDKKIPVETAFEYKDVIQKIDNLLATRQQLEEQQAKLRKNKDDEDWSKAREAGLKDQRQSEEKRKLREEKDARDWQAARETGLKEEKEAAERKRLREEKDARDWQAAREAGLKEQKEAAERKRLREEKDARDWEAARQAGLRDQEYQQQKRKAYEETLGKIAADLVKEGILARSGDLSSFSLGRGEFLVNGEKQSFETYNRFKSRYIKSPEEYYRYNFDPNKRPHE